MSKNAIRKNNQACINIDNAIKHYSDAYEKISSSNTHPSAKEILTLINNEIERLGKIKSKIYNINSNITYQMNKDGDVNK